MKPVTELPTARDPGLRVDSLERRVSCLEQSRQGSGGGGGAVGWTLLGVCIGLALGRGAK